MSHDARAFWLARPGRGEIRDEVVADPGPGEVLVQALHSAVSRGTEALVFHGQVPPAEASTMRAPFQDGDFPGPVKYGYLSVGRVRAGPANLVGAIIFCLYPHQTAYVVPAPAVLPVPDGVPPRRATLAGTLETAVNALWDAAPLLGDRVTVIGAGMVGCCLARLLAGIPGTQVTLCDIDPARQSVAERLDVAFAHPDDAPDGCDLVFDTSAASDGLQQALRLLADEGTVVELSWYGDRQVQLSLGERFHSGRLRVVASQVGKVAPARRGTRSTRDRLALALRLLCDPVFDALLTGDSPFDRLPEVMPRLADRSLPAICHTISYPSDE